jgi:hypothetical protein
MLASNSADVIGSAHHWWVSIGFGPDYHKKMGNLTLADINGGWGEPILVRRRQIEHQLTRNHHVNQQHQVAQDEPDAPHQLRQNRQSCSRSVEEWQVKPILSMHSGAVPAPPGKKVPADGCGMARHGLAVTITADRVQV